MMWTGTEVTVVIAGRRIDSSRSARLEGDVIVGPIDPFVRDIAERIEGDGTNRRFVIRRGDRSVTFEIGRSIARTDAAAQTRPLAPMLRRGEPFVPLAAIARDLGATVCYDRASKTLSIVLSPLPIVTVPPVVRYVPPPGPLPTFTAKPTPAPQATVTGIPHPRRTPILLEPE
jgi:hypothetical protein